MDRLLLQVFVTIFSVSICATAPTDEDRTELNETNAVDALLLELGYKERPKKREWRDAFNQAAIKYDAIVSIAKRFGCALNLRYSIETFGKRSLQAPRGAKDRQTGIYNNVKKKLRIRSRALLQIVKQLVSFTFRPPLRSFDKLWEKLKDFDIYVPATHAANISEDLTEAIIRLGAASDAKAAWTCWEKDKVTVWERRRIPNQKKVVLLEGDRESVDEMAKVSATSVQNELADEMELSPIEREYLLGVVKTGRVFREQVTEKYTECTWILYASDDDDILKLLGRLEGRWSELDRAARIDKFCNEFSILWNLLSEADFHGADIKTVPQSCVPNTADYEYYMSIIAGDNKYKQDVARALFECFPRADRRPGISFSGVPSTSRVKNELPILYS